MEMKIEQISNGGVVFNNVVLNGSSSELIEYMKTFGMFKETGTVGACVQNISKPDKYENYKIEGFDIDSAAEKINLEYILIDSMLLKPEDRTALLNCIPNYITKYKRIEPSKIPAFIMKSYDSVCAYVFKYGDIEKSLEYTIAKYNKLLFNRTSPANIISVYKIDGKCVVILTQYPVRESL